MGYDFEILKNNKSYKVEIKHFSPNSELSKFYSYDKSLADIIITNGTLERSLISKRNNAIVIDRAYLKDICKKNSLLESIITSR